MVEPFKDKLTQKIFLLQKDSLNILEKYKEAFDKSLGQVKEYKAKILVDANATPKYMKARSIPYYYREKFLK